MTATTPPPPATPARPRRRRRALLWVALVALLMVAQSLLVWMTLDYENNRAQEQVDAAAATAIADLRLALGRDVQSLQALTWNALPWRSGAPTRPTCCARAASCCAWSAATPGCASNRR
jgi:two-component system sensor histidine kinase DctS